MAGGYTNSRERWFEEGKNTKQYFMKICIEMQTNHLEEYDFQEDLKYQYIRKLSDKESGSLEGYTYLNEAAETLYKIK